jgi:hypothetical protein
VAPFAKEVVIFPGFAINPRKFPGLIKAYLG